MKKIRIIIIAFVLMNMFSCTEDFLTPDLTSSEQIDKALTTSSDLHYLVLGIYSSLNNASYYGKDMLVFGDVRSDDVYNAKYTGRYIDITNYNVNSKNGDVASIWSTLYSCIGQANIVINNTSIEQDNNVKFYKAQALALRGLFYFDLNRLFGQKYCSDNSGLSVPIVTEYDKTGESQGKSRATITEVESQITSDLRNSIALMDESGVYGDSKLEITRDAVKAILARHYLYIGQDALCKSICKELISQGNYSFYSSKNYSLMWTDKESSSSIFELAYTNSDYLGTNSYPYLFAKDGYGDFKFTDPLLNLYTSDEVNYPYVATKDADGKDSTTDSKILKKMPSIDQQNTNIKVLRYAEIILNYIESSIKTNTLTGDDVNILNNMLTKRGAHNLSKADLTLNKLLEIKRKEFAGEGFRFFDLIRNAKGFNTISDDGSFNETYEYPNNKFAFPIPFGEMQSHNTGIRKQNPGYE